MTNLAVFLKKRKWLLISGIVIVAAGYYFFHGKQAVSPYETTQVTKGDVTQEVSVTGHVESDSEVELSFERSGKVVSVLKDVGDKVQAGNALVRLDTSELASLRSQAVANMDYEQAKLDELKKGSRPEDIAVSQAQVESAQQALDDSARTLAQKITDAYTKADDAIRNNADQLFTNPRTTSPHLNLPLSDQKLQADIENALPSIETILNVWVNDMTVTQADAPSVVSLNEQRLDQIKIFLEKLALAVNSIIPSSQTSQLTIDGWKQAVSAARANINLASQALVSADAGYRSAKSALAVAENALSLKRAGATPEAIAAQEARIASGRATIANYDAQLNKLTLVAPFKGIVTKQDAKLGKNIVAGTPLVSVMSDGMYKITANIPEVDVAKIALGNEAKVTLDAYGSDVNFPASVTTIEPAATVVEGVPTYKVTLRFKDADLRIKSGMTANITIKTDSRTGVLVIPGRAITARDGKKYVRVLTAGVAGEKEVTIGLRGSDGLVEILSGLNQGESVITFEKTK